SNNYRPLHHMLRDHAVGRSLRGRGYRLLHTGGWWDPTRHNPYADESLDFYGRYQSEFARMLVAGTLFFRAGLGFGMIDQRREHWECVRFQFAQLEEVARRPGPKFVFAHMMVTHEPYVFDHAGRFLPLEQANAMGEAECYREALRFTNRRVLALLSRLQSADHPAPVIVLQADEGPYPPEAGAPGFTWHAANAPTLRYKMGILNAFYFPDGADPALHPGITPVNTFRVVFNHCFGSGLALLPDRCFVFRDARHGYDLMDITERLAEGCDSAAVAGRSLGDTGAP
ncbi:MAG: hypothetical protein QHJ73_13165, partial [Armatimonadota bacterium]|nr:hypothetical protein [Armatimonadota bacterium]